MAPQTTTPEILKAAESAGQQPLGLERLPEITGKGSVGAVEFTFEYSGYLFAVRAEARGQGAHMSFRAILGHLPYTAEDPVGRQSAVAVLNSAGRALGGRVNLTADQRLVLGDEFDLDEPMTPIVLMSRAAQLLIQAKPYLEVLSEYVQPPAVQ